MEFKNKPIPLTKQMLFNHEEVEIEFDVDLSKEELLEFVDKTITQPLLEYAETHGICGEGELNG